MAESREEEGGNQKGKEFILEMGQEGLYSNGFLTHVMTMIYNLIKRSFISGYFGCTYIFNNPYLFLSFGVRFKCYSIAHSFSP